MVAFAGVGGGRGLPPVQGLELGVQAGLVVRIWPVFRDGNGPSGRQQDSLAEQREAGAAVRLPFEHLDPVDVAFDHA